jgi:hypothetical protein
MDGMDRDGGKPMLDRLKADLLNFRPGGILT